MSVRCWAIRDMQRNMIDADRVAIQNELLLMSDSTYAETDPDSFGYCGGELLEFIKGACEPSTV